VNRTRSKREEDPVKSVEKIIALSDKDFAEWVDTVVNAGLKLHK